MYTQQAALLLARSARAADVAREPSGIEARHRRDARQQAAGRPRLAGLLARGRRSGRVPEAACSEG